MIFSTTMTRAAASTLALVAFIVVRVAGEEQQEQLARLLGDDARSFASGAAPDELRAVALMAAQSVGSGIDYATLGHSYSHPYVREEYAAARHPSITCAASRRRQRASCLLYTSPSPRDRG